MKIQQIIYIIYNHFILNLLSFYCQFIVNLLSFYCHFINFYNYFLAYLHDILYLLSIFNIFFNIYSNYPFVGNYIGANIANLP